MSNDDIDYESKAIQHAQGPGYAGVVYALLYLAGEMRQFRIMVEKDIERERDKPGDLFMGHPDAVPDD